MSVLLLLACLGPARTTMYVPDGMETYTLALDSSTHLFEFLSPGNVVDVRWEEGFVRDLWVIEVEPSCLTVLVSPADHHRLAQAALQHPLRAGIYGSDFPVEPPEGLDLERLRAAPGEVRWCKRVGGRAVDLRGESCD